MSKLTKHQKKTFRHDWGSGNESKVLIAEVRFDDQCGNGHNTFSVTGCLYDTHHRPGEDKLTHQNGRKVWASCFGCLHDEIKKHIPHLEKYLRWHLCSTDGPMHYIANAKYWYDLCDGKPNSPPIDHFKSTIVYGALPSDAVRLRAYINEPSAVDWPNVAEILCQRLELLLQTFRQDIESLGFTW